MFQVVEEKSYSQNSKGTILPPEIPADAHIGRHSNDALGGENDDNEEGSNGITDQKYKVSGKETNGH